MIVSALLLICGLGLTYIVHELRKAPEGYEDQNGFHTIPDPAAQRDAAQLFTRESRRPRRVQPATAH
jgi:hypothetical protein